MSVEDFNEETNDSSQPVEGGEDLDGSFVSSRKPADKGALGVLMLLVAFGGGLYFMYLHNGPSSASAATREQAAATTTIDEFLKGNGSSNLMEQTLRDTEKVVHEFQSTSTKPQVPVSDLSTNPFRLKQPENGAKEDDSSARARERMLAERSRISHEAASLELQSVMHGSNSACMVNNAMYHVGDTIGSFKVDEIRTRSVIVKQGPYRFELTMKR